MDPEKKLLREITTNQTELLQRIRTALFNVGDSNNDVTTLAIRNEDRSSTSIFWLLRAISNSWTSALYQANGWYRAKKELDSRLIHERSMHTDTLRHNIALQTELKVAKKRIAELELANAAYSLEQMKGMS
tara:strand:- start:697 stop:1089 length:393 start_codon:yes stop_codon:yes gene_type:complete